MKKPPIGDPCSALQSTCSFRKDFFRLETRDGRIKNQLYSGYQFSTGQRELISIEEVPNIDTTFRSVATAQSCSTGQGFKKSSGADIQLRMKCRRLWQAPFPSNSSYQPHLHFNMHTVYWRTEIVLETSAKDIDPGFQECDEEVETWMACDEEVKTWMACDAED
ncbi:hypothetical protein TNCV_3482791 [Trichonephila clavipes]|nr:hypothetical protein TNCV_3482791 [Trichonephila clavipes]